MTRQSQTAHEHVALPKAGARERAGARTFTGSEPLVSPAPGTELRRGSSALHWRPAGDTAPFTGKTCLVDSTGATLAVLDFGCYVQQLPSGVVLLWHHEWERTLEGKLEHPRIRLLALDPALLTPVGDLKAVCDGLDDTHDSVYIHSGMVAETRFSAALPAGSYDHGFPEVMREAAEVLILAAPELDRLALYVVDTAKGVIGVYPQDWFNRANLDYAYQWVTRVAREPATGRIRGEGFRIDPFVLDASLRRLR